jgi:hypothetical protein
MQERADETERLWTEIAVRLGVTVVGNSHGKPNSFLTGVCARESMAGRSSLGQMETKEVSSLR